MGTEVERLLQEQLRTPAQQPPQGTAVDRLLSQTEDTARLRTSFNFSDSARSERSANLLRLQERTQLPLDLIERNFDQVVRDASKADFDPVKYRANSPIVAEWLAEHPEHVNVAREDLTRLSYLERQLRYIKDQFSAGRGTTELRDIGYAAIMGNVTPQQRARQKELQKQLGRLQDVDYGITGFFEGIPGAVANQLPIMARTLFSGLQGAAVGALAGGSAAALAGQAGPQIATPEEILTVPGAAAAGARAGWKLGAVVEAGTMEASLAFLEFEDLKFADGRHVDRNAALGAAVVVGVVNGLLENIGFQKMASTIPGLGRLTKSELQKALTSKTIGRSMARYLRNIGESAVTEGFTEYMQEITKNAAGLLVDPNAAMLSPEAIMDRLFQGALESARMGAQAGGGFTMATSTTELAGDIQAARRATRTQEFFQSLGENLADSKLAEIAPAQLEEVVSRLTKDGPTEDVYIPITYFQEVTNKQGLNPAEVAESILGDRAEYDEAVATQGDLKIPTAKYAAKVARTDLHKAFVDELRFGPMELSAREARERVAAIDKEQTAEPTAEEQQREAETKEVTERIKQQLMASKPELYDESTAQTAAQVLVGRVFRNISTMTGMTPLQILNKYGLSVQLGKDDPLEATAMSQADELFWDTRVEQLRTAGPIERQWMAWDEQANDPNNSEEVRAFAAERSAKMRETAMQARREREAQFTAALKELREQRAIKSFSQADLRVPSGVVRDLEAHYSQLDLSTQQEQALNKVVDLPTRQYMEFILHLRDLAQTGGSDALAVYLATAKDSDEMKDRLQIAFDAIPSLKTWLDDYLREPPSLTLLQTSPLNNFKPLPPGFHSKAERIIEAKMPNRATPQEVKALLKEVKAEERKWLDLDKALDNPGPAALLIGDGKIGKENLLNYLRAHRLEIQTIVLSSANAPSPSDAEITGQLVDRTIEEADESIEWDIAQTVRMWDDQGHRFYFEHRTSTLFKQLGPNQWVYELPVRKFLQEIAGRFNLDRDVFTRGGDFDELGEVHDWRDWPHEAAFTPDSKAGEQRTNVYFASKEDAMADLEEQLDAYVHANDELEDEYITRARDIVEDDFEVGLPHSEWTMPGGENYRIIQMTLPSLPGPVYRDGHFEEVENLLVWARTKNRTLADGSQVLFIEEIQSDWHQTGRYKGYDAPRTLEDTQEEAEALAEYNRLIDERSNLIRERSNLIRERSNLIRTLDPLTKGTPEEDELAERLNNQLEEVGKAIEAIEDLRSQRGWGSQMRKVPDAPFRNNVQEFMIKRLVRLAAEEGLAGIGLTTGDQQVKMWDLSTHVQRLDWASLHPDEPSAFRLQAWTPDQELEFLGGERAIPDEAPPRIDRIVSAEKLIDAVGKEVAQQIFDEAKAGHIKGRLEREQLTVGGHGRRHQYDVIIAGALRDLAKKYKSTVQMQTYEANIEEDNFDAYYMPIPDEMRQVALNNEFTLFQRQQAQKGYVWQGAIAELSSAISDVHGVLASYEGDVEAMAAEQGHTLDVGEIYQKLLTQIEERDPAAAYSFLTALPRNFQIVIMRTFPMTFQYIMQNQVLSQSQRSQLAEDALEELGFIHEAIWAYRNEDELALPPKMTDPEADRLEGFATRLEALIKHDKLDQAAKEYYEFIESEGMLAQVFEAYAQESLPMLMDLYSGRGLPQGKAKGRIRIGAREIKIDLLEHADLSTFIHEIGHFYLEMLSDLGTEPNADAQLVKDYQAIRNWLGLKEGDSITREHHELFARGFEKYLGEGKAPVQSLRRAFARFKAWLFTIYSSLDELQVELNDEVRHVFDRLLAGHEELAAAEAMQYQPLDLSGLNLPAAEIERYQDALEAARLAGEEELSKRIIQDFEREKTRVWQAERAKVLERVGNQANSDPAMRAYALLRYGTLPNGEPLPENIEAFKLSRTAVHAQWPAEVGLALPKRMLSGKGGLHPNLAADLLGFNSGDELLNAMQTTENPRAWIQRVTNERMRSRKYAGTPLKESEIALEAQRAVHNEQRAKLLQMELQYLASNNLPALKGLIRRVARRVAPTRVVREEAARIIASKELRDVNPLRYQRAEAQASKEALEALLKGDIELAFDAKQREQLNHELYRAALRAQDRVEKIIDYMQRFNEKRVRERLAKAGGDYLAQIDGIRERFDFAKRVTLKELDKRRDLREFMKEQEDDGIAAAIPEDLLKEAYRKHFKEMSLEELETVYQGVRVIEKLSRLKNKLLASTRARTIREAIDEMNASILDHHEVKPERIDYAPGLAARIAHAGRGISAAHQKPEFIAEWLDGNVNLGPVWSHLFKPIADAEAAENAMRRQRIIELKSLFSTYSKFERATWFYRRRDFGPGLGSLTKANVLTIALNWGNQYNREALMEGNKLTEKQVERVLATLDQRDWQLVQGIWDYLESFWPEIAALEKDINGIAPVKVEATPVVTPYGTMRGGYYPIVFDSQLSLNQAAIEIKEGVTEMFGRPFYRAQTRHGHTKERTDTGGKPLKLNLSGLTTHVSNVMHDLTHRRAVIDVSRLIRHPDFKATVESTVGRHFYRQLHPWLVNVASGERAEFFNPIEGIMGRARNGATVVNMGWKLTTAMVQFLSFTNTIKELGLKYSSLGISDVYSKPWKFKSTWQFVTSRSEFMRHRIENFDRDVNDALKNLNVSGVNAGPLSVIGAYGRPLRDSFFMFIGFMDMGVSLPTWLGAYRRAMEGGLPEIAKGDEPAAIDYADKVVRQTQGVGAAKDLATIQRGPNTLKLFTMFYSYFSVLFGQFAKSTHQLQFDKNVARFTASILLLWFLPAALESYMRGDAPDPDDDPEGEDWFRWLVQTEAQYPFQTVVVLRDIINGMDRFGYEPSAAFDMFENITKAGKAGLEALPVVGKEDDEFTREELKSTVHAVGYVTQLPTRQLWLTSEYLHDWLTGELEPENPLEAAWRAAVTGKPRED